MEILEGINLDLIDLMEEESTKFENLNEGLQATEKGQKLEENVSSLESISENIAEQLQELENLIES